MQRDRALALARELVARAPQGSIASIFAGGSLGRGEVWAAENDGGLDVYSDVDLYVVARAPSDVGAIRAAARTIAALDSTVPGARFLRAADIGVYTRADLAAQPLRPGTAELARYHVTLYGDDGIPAGLRNREATEIPMEEALYLLENRAMELSGAGPDAGAHARLALAQALKARLDVYAAHAIMARSFAPTLARRSRDVRENPPSTLAGEALQQVQDAFAGANDIGAWMQGRNALEERHRALAALAGAWRILAPVALGMDGAPDALLARRCREGSRFSNAREVLRIRSAAARPFWRAAVGAPALSRFAPIPALRVDALARAFAGEHSNAHALGAHFAYVERLTRCFGFTDGPLETRVRVMHAAIS